MQGILIIPAFDPAGTLEAHVIDNDVHDNGSFGLQATDFTHVNGIRVTGGRYVNNTGAGILLAGWKSSSVSGEIAFGSNVGLSIANSVPNSAVGAGFLSGSVYDLEVQGPLSNANISGVILDHGTIGGVANVKGFSSVLISSLKHCNSVTQASGSAPPCASGLLDASKGSLQGSRSLTALAAHGFSGARSVARPLPSH